MKKLIETMYAYVFEEKKIPEDLIYEFSKETIKIAKSGRVEMLPEQFWEFENYVETFWRGRKYNQIDDLGRVYQMGRLLSFTSMLSMVVEEKEKEISLEDYASQWKGRYTVFRCVYEHRGITHKKLATNSGMSTSALSQFMNKVRWNGFFYCRSMGREKHYYLTEYGEQLYNLMTMRCEKPKPTYAKLLGAVDNLNEMISQDKTYKVVMEEKQGKIVESIYATNSDDVSEKPIKLLNIITEEQLLSNEEDSTWKTKRNWKMLNRIS